jgi:hypothetical protein
LAQDGLALAPEVTVMAAPIVWKEITTAYKGRLVGGSYAVEGEMVKVKTTLGESEAPHEGIDASLVAWRLLRELAAEEKA